MTKVMIMDHPLIQHKIGIIRNEKTEHKVFRELVSEISMLMAYEVTRDLALEDEVIRTPMAQTTVKTLQEDQVSLIPILRAGLGMIDGMLTLIPNARVGFVGLYRDHDTSKPIEYYCKLPDIVDESLSIVLDPMLATGGSAIAAINLIKAKGGKNIKFVCLIAAPEGIEALSKAHPDVDIYAAAKDERLNEINYILPGLGDAGDRLYGTK
ncbi:MAG: uracil phosphoribosyltransferase [Eubacteriaceae bacterium]|nr:uracil phosphoribosyltransferase [Eubacteriaceae bacterium]